MIRQTLILVALLASSAAVTHASIPVTPGTAQEVELGNGAPLLRTLKTAYYSGKATDVDDAVRAIRDRLVADYGGVGGNDLGLEDGATWIVTFVDPSRGAKGSIVRFVWHEAEPNSIYSADLIGVQDVVEVWLSFDGGETLASIYSMDEKRNPLLDQLPKFFKDWKLGDIRMFSRVLDERPLLVRRAPLRLPVSRGTLVIKDEAKTPGAKPSDLRDAYVAKLAAQGARPPMGSDCETGPEGGAASPDSSEELPEHLVEKVCNLSRDLEALVRTSQCARAFVEPITATLVDRLRAGIDGNAAQQWRQLNALITRQYLLAAQSDACARSSSLSDSLLHVEALDEARDAFRALFQGEKKSISATHSFESTPKARYSLGLLSAAMVDESGDRERTKLSSGKLEADPLSGALNGFVVNIHPVRFDGTTEWMTGAERFRFFVGITFDPEFGLLAGVSMQLVRNLSLNVGYGFLEIDELVEGDEFGAEPADKQNPFDDGDATVIFVGFGYSF